MTVPSSLESQEGQSQHLLTETCPAYLTLPPPAYQRTCADGQVQRCRFLTLVDVLYEHNIRLFCSSEGLPFELFQHIMTRSQANEPKVMQVCCFAPMFC